MDGTLYKYTNFAKGWQRRYFVLEGSTLNYYLREPNATNPNKKSRGSLPIIGAHITPSDEDGLGFTVSAPNEVVYKLKAADARNRQRWVDYLRAAASGAPLETSSGLSESCGGASGVDAPNKTKLSDQLNAARESLTAARQYLAQLEDYTDQRPINVDHLRVLAYARSAVRTLEMAMDNADRNMLFGKSSFPTNRPSLAPPLDKDGSSSSEDESEDWLPLGEDEDVPLGEYTDDQRATIVSMMQTVPFGGELFSQSWPEWIHSADSGLVKLARLCAQCPETTDPIELVKWILFVSDIDKLKRVPTEATGNLKAKCGAMTIDIGRSNDEFTCCIENEMNIKFTLSLSSPYRGPGKPYAIKITLSDICIGRQTWSVLQTPEIRVSHPLSAPKLAYVGKWRLRNVTDETKVDLELTFDSSTGRLSGTLQCGQDQEYKIRTESNGDIFINDDQVTFKQRALQISP